MSEITITIDQIDPIDFFGVNNEHVEILRNKYKDVQITSRGSRVFLKGERKNISIVKETIDQILYYIEINGAISPTMIESIIENGTVTNKGEVSEEDVTILRGANNQLIKAKTPNQLKIVQKMNHHDISFVIGPAGTGKTYTAVALAVRALKSKIVNKIILTRPAVEAGESLGFLPGDMKEKVDPYLRPLYDALDDMIPAQKLNYYIENRVIEIAPLAYMRGRTLNNAFIILDEAQNATEAQLKMFLTRIGPIAKCIITGDLTQIDLPKRHESGLRKSLEILKNIAEIGFVYLDSKDVVRHRLVKQIIDAYEQSDNAEKGIDE